LAGQAVVAALLAGPAGGTEARPAGGGSGGLPNQFLTKPLILPLNPFVEALIFLSRSNVSEQAGVTPRMNRATGDTTRVALGILSIRTALIQAVGRKNYAIGIAKKYAVARTGQKILKAGSFGTTRCPHAVHDSSFCPINGLVAHDARRQFRPFAAAFRSVPDQTRAARGRERGLLH